MITLLTPAVSHARPIRIALIDVVDDAGGVGEQVIGALTTSELELVSGKRVARALARLGSGAALDSEGLARLAAELAVDAVVRCELDEPAHRLYVKVVTRGAAAERFSIAARDTGSGEFRIAVRGAMLVHIAAMAGSDDAREVTAPRRVRGTSNDEVSEGPPQSRGRPHRTGDVVDDTERPRPRRIQDDVPAPAPARAERVDRSGAADGDIGLPGQPRLARRPRADGDEQDAPTLAATARVARAREPSTSDSEEPSPGQRNARVQRSASGRAGGRDAGPATAPAKRMRLRSAPDATAAGGERRSDQPALRSASLAAIRVDAGFSAIGRSIDFSSPRATGMPASYSHPARLGARAAIEVYPGAFDDRRGWLARFGVAADYEQSLAEAGGTPTSPSTGSQRHLAIGLRYRFALGAQPTSSTLTFGVGYAALIFMTDRAQPMTSASSAPPDTDYRMFDPGLAFRLPLGDSLALTLGGSALFVLSAGAVQRPDQYGDAIVFGATAACGFEIEFTDRIVLRLAGEALQLKMAFNGNGTRTSSRDSDVNSMTDRYYGGAATLALVY